MTNLEATIDALGDIKEQIKELEAKETALKKELKTLGIGTHVGTKYVMTLSEQSRDVLDMKAVKEKLSSQFITAHTSVTKYPMFRFSKRNTDAEAA
jgi:hypothetical protein